MNNEESTDSRLLNEWALTISREALDAMEVPECPSEFDFATDKQFQVFRLDDGNRVGLLVLVDVGHTRSQTRIELDGLVSCLISELRVLLSGEEARKVLNLPLDAIGDTMFDTARDLTVGYISHVPVVLSHLLTQCLHEVAVSYIRKEVEPNLRRYWDEELQKPKGYSLVPNGDLYKLSSLFPPSEALLLNLLRSQDNQLRQYRRQAYADNRAYLTPEAIEALPTRYNALRSGYAKAKKSYKSQRDAYYTVNRRASIDDWTAHWAEISAEDFPDLTLTDELISYTASQLAYKQLGDTYGQAMTTMEKTVRKAKNRITRAEHIRLLGAKPPKK